MIEVAATLAGTAVIIALGMALTAAGIRSGDRPGDARLTAALAELPAPDGPQAVVVATIRNPGPVAVLVGLSVHRSRMPGWLGAGMGVTVPRRTARRRYGPSGQDTVGVVAPGESAAWPIPVPAPARICHLVAVMGQAEGRLRVIRLPVRAGSGRASYPADPGRPAPEAGRLPRWTTPGARDQCDHSRGHGCGSARPGRARGRPRQ